MFPIRRIKNWVPKIILGAALVANMNAFAGETIIGNGGDAVVCRDSAGVITSVEVLDVYEARILFGRVPNMAGVTYVEKVNDVLANISSLSPWRSSQYGEWLSEFATEWNLVPNTQLIDIPDTDHLAIPNNCVVEQIAIQREPTHPGEKRYLVNKDLWDFLDEDNKAALVLHEYIYREAISDGHENSVLVRKFNGLMFANLLPGYSESDFFELIKSFKLDTVTIMGVVTSVSSLSYYQETLSRVEVKHPSTIILPEATIVVTQGHVNFKRNSDLSDIYISSVNETAGQIEFNSKPGQLIPIDSIEFHENGFPQSISPLDIVELSVRGTDVTFRPERISFWENGVIRGGDIALPLILWFFRNTGSGNDIPYRDVASGATSFNLDGYVTHSSRNHSN